MRIVKPRNLHYNLNRNNSVTIFTEIMKQKAKLLAYKYEEFPLVMHGRRMKWSLKNNRLITKAFYSSAKMEQNLIANLSLSLSLSLSHSMILYTVVFYIQNLDNHINNSNSCVKSGRLHPLEAKRSASI